jgi:hypothetical protein
METPLEPSVGSPEIASGDPVSTIVDLGYGVTSTRGPTLDEVARALDFATETLQTRIRDRIRCGESKADYETDVFDLAALGRAQKLVRCVALCEPVVTETIQRELARLRAQEQTEFEREIERKEKARYWAQRRREEKESSEAKRNHAY